MTMTLNKKIIMGIMILVLMIAASYTLEYTYKNAGTKSGSIIKITNNNQTAAFMGSDVLKKLAGGTKNKSEEGPTLTSVLVAAGISDFSKVQITGVREGASSYVASKAEISNDIIFYYTDHNTVNLAKKDNHQVLVEDVSTINAQS